MSIWPEVCLTVPLSVYLLCLSLCCLFCLFLSLSCMSACLSLCLCLPNFCLVCPSLSFVYLSVSVCLPLPLLSVFVSFCLSAYLFVCLPVAMVSSHHYGNESYLMFYFPAGEALRRRRHPSHVRVRRRGGPALVPQLILHCQPRGVPICALFLRWLQRWQMHRRLRKY